MVGAGREILIEVAVDRSIQRDGLFSAHPVNHCNSWGMARLKPRWARLSPIYLWVAGNQAPEPSSCYFPECALAGSWTRNGRAGTQTRPCHMAAPSSSLPCCATHKLWHLCSAEAAPVILSQPAGPRGLGQQQLIEQ